MASEKSSQDVYHGRGRQHQTLGSPQPRHRSKSTRLSHRRRPEVTITHKDDHLVKIFSRSADLWLLGEITRLIDDDCVRVEYRVGKDWYCKTLHVHSENLLTLSLQRLDLEMFRTFGQLSSAQCLQDHKQASNGGVSHIERSGEEHDPGMVWSAAELNKRSALTSYFLREYLNGEDPPSEDLRHAGYTVRFNDEISAEVFCHEPSGIQVWSEALDLSTPGRDSSEIRIGFHYTTPQAFSTVTHIGNEAVEIWASMKDAGDAYFGEGVYTSQRDSHEFGSMEAVLYNNYAIKDDPSKLAENWDFARCCIPILVDHEACIDVRRQTTPEMTFGPGIDRLGKPLGQGRDVVVLRITDHEDRVLNARAPDNLLTVLKKRLMWRMESFGENHPCVAAARNSMGRVYSKQSKFGDALREYEEALRIRMAALGKNHPCVAATRNNMAMVYTKQCMFGDALREYEESLRIRMAAFGKNHPNVATTRNNMAEVYVKQCLFGDALRECEEALRFRMATVGKNHREVAIARNNIATAYFKQCMFGDALREYEEALRIMMTTSGKNHPDVAIARNNIASIYFKQCRFGDALREYEEALRIRMATIGKNHPDVAATRNNMAMVYTKQCMFGDALREYEEALRICMATIGKNHPDVATIRNNMATVYFKQCMFGDALREYEEALRIMMATSGKNHPDVATTLKKMATVYFEQCMFGDALLEYEEALRIQRATLGDDHPDVATTRKQMGTVYEKASNLAAAMRR